MSSSIPANVTSAIQSASINRHPSPSHDINPSTAASTKRPVSPTTSIASSESSIPTSALKTSPRRANLPPLPDLRFEQSYLASLDGVDSWRGVAWITTRDQVLSPLVQGVLWTLVLSGWRYWNRGAAFKGQGLGGTVRKWWWGVNNWKLPEGAELEGKEKLAEQVRDVNGFQRWWTSWR